MGARQQWWLPCYGLGQPRWPPCTSCSSSHVLLFCSELGQFLFPGQKLMKCSLQHGFPFQPFTFASSRTVPPHSRIPPGCSVLTCCPPRACPPFPPQTPLAVRRCCCLPQILLSLPCPLPSPQALHPCREACKGEEGGLCLPRAAGSGGHPPPSPKSADNLGETKQFWCPPAANGFGKDPSRRLSDGKCVL